MEEDEKEGRRREEETGSLCGQQFVRTPFEGPRAERLGPQNTQAHQRARLVRNLSKRTPLLGVCR